MLHGLTAEQEAYLHRLAPTIDTLTEQASEWSMEEIRKHIRLFRVYNRTLNQGN